MIGAIMDISHRKRAEERLAQSEARLRIIIGSEPECVKLLDREGNVLEMNPAGRAMIEADSSSEVLGNSVYPMVALEYRQVFKEFQKSAFQGNSGKLEFEVIGLKGTRRWLEFHAVPGRDKKGNITASLTITRDISERKHLQRKILEFSEQERQRLRQDLHDQLGQSLAGIALLTKGLQRKLSLWSLSEAIVAGPINELVNQAIVRTRGFVRGYSRWNRSRRV